MGSGGGRGDVVLMTSGWWVGVWERVYLWGPGSPVLVELGRVVTVEVGAQDPSLGSLADSETPDLVCQQPHLENSWP